MAADPPPSSPQPRPPAVPGGMVDIGAHLGASVWWCQEAFAVVGGWVPSVPEAPARAHAAELSRVLGELGGSLAAHLPRPAPVRPRDWVVAPSPDAPAVVAALAAPPATLERLAGVHRVLVPRLLTAWAGLASAPEPARGRALGRALAHARTDLRDLAEEGEALVQAQVAAVADGAQRAAAHVGSVEAALVAAGGLLPAPPPAIPPSGA